jgi:hypothetical protein
MVVSVGVGFLYMPIWKVVVIVVVVVVVSVYR